MRVCVMHFFFFFPSGQRRLRQMSTWKFVCGLCDVFFFLFLTCALVHHNLFCVMIVRIENAEFQSILIGGIISS